MSEEAVTFGANRSLVGILHRPSADRDADRPAVLLLNAGILHRVGPNRLYVRIARELERQGFTVLRFDLAGIGDSQDGASAEGRTFFDDTVDAMQFVQQRVGATRFMLMGICMGAKIALEVARRDTRVETLVLMEGIYVKSARYYVSRLLDASKWKKLVTGDSHLVKQVRQRVQSRLRPKKPAASGAAAATAPPATIHRPLFLDQQAERNMGETLRTLLGRGAKIMLVFRDGNEIAYNYRLQRRGDDIRAVGLPRGLDVAFIPFADHTFTPVGSQDLLLQATMAWIERAHPQVTRPVSEPAAVAM
jgi:alpha/beta superfamily hydrolase